MEKQVCQDGDGHEKEFFDHKLFDSSGTTKKFSCGSRDKRVLGMKRTVLQRMMQFLSLLIVKEDQGLEMKRMC